MGTGLRWDEPIVARRSWPPAPDGRKAVTPRGAFGHNEATREQAIEPLARRGSGCGPWTGGGTGHGGRTGAFGGMRAGRFARGVLRG